jgi:cyclase
MTMRRMYVLGILLAAGAVSIAARQGAQQPQPLGIEKVRENLFMITGAGGNTAAFITATGVVVVDTKNPNNGARILEQIKSVTDKPVTMIINTHTHGDHVGSNKEFPASVEVVVHANTRTNMERMPAFQGDGAAYLPKRTFTDRQTLLSGADRIDLYYFGRGHTNGDAIVVFPALRVAHTGDLFAAPGTPIMDVNNGGSGLAYPDTVKKAAAGIKGVDTVIPGHSAVTTWAAFAEYGEFMQALVSAIQQAHKEGKTADDALAGLTLPEKFKSYNMGRAKGNITAIYGELTK